MGQRTRQGIHHHKSRHRPPVPGSARRGAAHPELTFPNPMTWSSPHSAQPGDKAKDTTKHNSGQLPEPSIELRTAPPRSQHPYTCGDGRSTGYRTWWRLCGARAPDPPLGAATRSPARRSVLGRRVAPARCRTGAPSEPCVPLVAAHGSSKPRGRCRLKCGFLALAGVERPLAGCVHEAGLVTVGRAGPPVMGEVAGGYRLAGDL
jgi:hypothetical protein